MTQVKQKLNYRVDKDFIKNYDELININLVRQPSDIGFTDYDKLMIRPRKPFLFQDSLPSVTGNCSNIFFCTDINNVTRAYRVVNSTTGVSRAWKIQYATVTPIAPPSTGIGTWTDCTNASIGTSPIQWDFKLSTVRIPTNFNGTESTIYTIWTQPTIVDRVTKAWWDPEGATAIGKIMLIYTGIYKGLYAPIIGYDTTTTEYIIQWSGAIVPFKTADTYTIYDTLADNVQILSKSNTDYYVDGTTRRSGILNFCTLSLRQSKVINSNEFIGEQISFNNSRWVFKGSTVFPSKGVPGNPFYYTLTGQYTVSKEEIKWVYVYRNRLICYGDSFIYAVKTDWVIEKITDSFGIQKDAIVSTWDDLMCITTDRRIVSINETINWALYVKDIADSLFNYTRWMSADCWAWADSENIYFGGRSRSYNITDRPYILVYNLVYKFWSVYTWPQILWVVSYNGIAYFTDAFLPWHRVLGGGFSNEYFGLLEYNATSTNTTSVASTVQQAYEQKVSTRWIDLGRIFEIKALQQVSLWFENLRTRADTTVFMLLDGKVWSKVKKTHAIDWVTNVSYLGINVTGQELLGWSTVTIDSYFPRIITEKYSQDRALSWKYVIQSVWEDGFYLNGMQINMMRDSDEEDYNNSENGR